MDALRELRKGVADLLEGQPYLQVFASDACLRRFLVARRQNIEEAITSLRLVLTSEPLRDCQTCWYPILAQAPKGALQWEHPYHGCTHTAYPCAFTVTCLLSTNQQHSTQKTELPPALLPGKRPPATSANPHIQPAALARAGIHWSGGEKPCRRPSPGRTWREAAPTAE